MCQDIASESRNRRMHSKIHGNVKCILGGCTELARSKNPMKGLRFCVFCCVVFINARK